MKTDTPAEQVTLYYRPQCPYCQKVISYIEENNISIEMVDISQDLEASNRLKRVGGKGQVPSLIFESAKYESDDIIAWLAANR